jgi:hypothetical protein
VLDSPKADTVFGLLHQEKVQKDDFDQALQACFEALSHLVPYASGRVFLFSASLLSLKTELNTATGAQPSLSI